MTNDEPIPDDFDPDGILQREAISMTDEEWEEFQKSRGCECGSGMRKHDFGKDESCEYFEHHCETCHEKGFCTIPECDMVKV